VRSGYRVSLETSGAIDIEPVDPRVVRVLDVKTPGSGEERRNRLENLPGLRATDIVKFVICNRVDYEWSRAVHRGAGSRGSLPDILSRRVTRSCRPASLPTGFSRIMRRCDCRFSSTSTCGAMCGENR